jgi:hypothetical protein
MSDATSRTRTVCPSRCTYLMGGSAMFDCTSGSHQGAPMENRIPSMARERMSPRQPVRRFAISAADANRPKVRHR